MACPDCKSENVEILPANHVIPGAEYSSMARSYGHPATASLGALFKIGSAVAKMTVYRAYRCKACGRQFRKL